MASNPTSWGRTTVLRVAIAAVAVAVAVGALRLASRDDPAGPTPQAARPVSWWVPAQGSTWHLQYSGAVDPTLPVDVYDLDGEDTSAAAVTELAERGVRTICYINAGAWEDWRSDAARFPGAVLGDEMAGWPGERWLDVRQLDVLVPIMTGRMRMCRDKGFDAVDADNVMGFEESTGFPLSAADQIRYNRALADAAHGLGLGFGLKNDAAQLDALSPVIDFAVNEECIEQGSCDAYRPLVRSGTAVFSVEYADGPGSLDEAAAEVCRARPEGFSTIVKRLELDAASHACAT